VLLREAIAKDGQGGIARVRDSRPAAFGRAKWPTKTLSSWSYCASIKSCEDSATLNCRKGTCGNTSDESEIELANKLITGMTTNWDAAAYHDEYRAALMKLVEKKVKRGETERLNRKTKSRGVAANDQSYGCFEAECVASVKTRWREKASGEEWPATARHEDKASS